MHVPFFVDRFGPFFVFLRVLGRFFSSPLVYSYMPYACFSHR